MEFRTRFEIGEVSVVESENQISGWEKRGKGYRLLLHLIQYFNTLPYEPYGGN